MIRPLEKFLVVTLEFTSPDHTDFSRDSMPPPLQIPKHFTGFAKGQ